MTSKEAIELIIEKLERPFYEDCNCLEEDEEKAILTIEKDLEVLNALKRNVGIRLAIQEWANKESKVFPNDRKIVKEWLENEKKC